MSMSVCQYSAFHSMVCERGSRRFFLFLFFRRLGGLTEVYAAFWCGTTITDCETCCMLFYDRWTRGSSMPTYICEPAVVYTRFGRGSQALTNKQVCTRVDSEGQENCPSPCPALPCPAPRGSNPGSSTVPSS